MKVAIDLRPLLEAHPGGVGAYTRSLLAGLADLPRVEVRPVVTGRGLGGLAGAAPAGLRRLPLPNPLVNAGMRLAGVPRLDRFADADRYLLPNWNFLALGRKTELTLVVHDLSFERDPSWFAPKQRLWHRLVAPKRLVARADRILAVSEWTKHDLVELYGVPEGKIRVAYPVPDRPPVELPFPVSLPERFILFVGAVEERKNPLSLVAAFERIADTHPDAHLVIAGKHGYGAARVLVAVRRSPVRERIRLLGYVPVPVRHALYRKATVFAYPSFYEGFGIPVVEAMHAGLPVVVGARSAMPEVVGDAGILVDPMDVGQLALALDATLADHAFARTLGGKAFVRAAQFPDSLAPALALLFG